MIQVNAKAGAILVTAAVFFPAMPLSSSELAVRMQWSWSVLGDYPGQIGFEVLDTNGDGKGELFVAPQSPSSWYRVEVDPSGALQQTLSSFFLHEGVISMDVAPGDPDVVAMLTQEAIHLFDAREGEELAVIPAGSYYNTSVAIADLDGNGVLDAIVCDYYDLYRYELLGGTETAVKYGFGCGDIAIGQTDLDPALEVAIVGNNSGNYILDGATLLVDWGDVAGIADRVELGDLDADGLDEMLTVRSYGYSDDGIWAVDPQSGELLWERDAYYPGGFAIGDVGGPPGEEVLIASDLNGPLQVLEGATGLLVHEISVNGHVEAVAFGEATGDAVPEIFWSTGGCCGASGKIYSAHADSDAAFAELTGPGYPIGGAIVGDLSGTGEIQVGVAGSMYSESTNKSGIAVHALDDGRRLRISGEGDLPFVPAHESIAGAQLDADPAMEICVANPGSWSGNGRIGCVDGADFETLWSTGLSLSPSSIVVAETDGDEFPELFSVTGQSRAVAQEAESGWLKWQTPPPGQDSYATEGIEIVDSDSNGQSEVVTFGFDNSPGYRNVAVFSAATGAPIAGPWQVFVTAAATWPASLPASELYVADGSGTIRRFDPLTGSIGPGIADFPSEIQRFVLADATRDDVVDVVAVGQDGRIRVWDGLAGAITWTGPDVGDSRTLLAGDLDSDTIPEIVVATWYGVVVFESGAVEDLWMDGFESGDVSDWSAALP